MPKKNLEPSVEDVSKNTTTPCAETTQNLFEISRLFERSVLCWLLQARTRSRNAGDGGGLDLVSQCLTWSSEGAARECGGGARARLWHDSPGQLRWDSSDS